MVDALLGISNVSANALLVLLCLRCFRILLTIGVDTHFFIDLVDIRMHYAFDLMNKYEQDPTPRVAIITSMRGGTPYAKDRPYIATVFVNNVGGSTFHVLMPPNRVWLRMCKRISISKSLTVRPDLPSCLPKSRGCHTMVVRTDTIATANDTNACYSKRNDNHLPLQVLSDCAKR